MPPALADLLGHAFRNPDLLQAALTHPSAGERDERRAYERLEFLGDRVLALAIAELLLERFPRDDEGALSRRLVSLVRAETLAEVADGLGLGRHLEMAPSARKDGARARISMLSDACEAVIGALYLDGGLEPARAFVRRHWASAVETGGKRPLQDAKTGLQEWLQGRGLALPTYTLVGQEGPAHAPEFTVEVRAENGRATTATGPSKRAAEQAAAEALLAQLEASE
ncbi:MAG: ribonuclease III [Alphaproteobacteria bacterium]|nr:ribonuclease III [Alphaproteobacteria bacterium]MCB9931697.1 ribonuclease III [Alphaproteobacteria bacterium]